MDNLPIPFPTRLPAPGVTYPQGTVLPWYAANTKLELKEAKKNPPEGFELLGMPKVTLKPRAKGYPHYMNGSMYPIYVLYVRKV